MYKYGNIEFEWDEAKAQENLDKHGVSFAEAVSSFLDEDGFRLEDLSHSIYEQRYYWVGLSSNDRVLTTYHTERGDRVRIIGSAEWRKFRRMYYERA